MNAANLQPEDLTEESSEDAGDDRYLIFKIGKETLAAPLLSIREIIQSLTYRHIPNEQDYYLGLANLRGQIVGVLDLGLRLGLEATENAVDGYFLVFEVDGSWMAGFVSSVESVLAIPPDAVSAKSLVDMKIPGPALKGIAQVDGHMLPIIQLSELVR